MAAGSSVRIAAADGASYESYLCGDAGAGRPALLIFTPIFGIDEEMRGIAEQWAERGFLVAVPDYFFRVVPGPLARSEESRKQAFARWEKLDVDRAVQDIRPLVSRLLGSKACNGRLGALGYCAGGELAFLAATRLGAQAVAAFHGTRIHRHLDEADRVPGALSLHFGGNDPLVPLEEVKLIEDRFRGDPRVDIAVYDGAGHGFSFPGRPSYHQLAATQSAEKAQAALATLMKDLRRAG
jgi:carboxymethylenebutenolidase